jgi:hypothetical protein
VISIPDNIYTFDGLDELHETANKLPEVERKEVHAYHPERDEWKTLPYRDSLWIEDGSAVGDVSASTDFYQVHQYGDIMESVALALDAYDDVLDPKGHVILSESGHKLSAYVDFADLAVEPEPDDVIDLGLKVRSGHTGFHGLKYDVGAERQVCRNGMLAFVSDFHTGQTHQEPLDYGLARTAVGAIVEGVDVIEDRLDAATDREFLNEDEALLVLMDHGFDAYFADPVATLRESLREEVNADQPTLYDTYNAATRAITHVADLPTGRRDMALDQAATLLDAAGTVPDPTDLGQRALERRVDTYATGDVDPYWDDEEESLHTLLEEHGDAA